MKQMFHLSANISKLLSYMLLCTVSELHLDQGPPGFISKVSIVRTGEKANIQSLSEYSSQPSQEYVSLNRMIKIGHFKIKVIIACRST